MRVVVPAANAQNAWRYLAVSACAWISLVLLLGMARGAENVAAGYLAGIILAGAVCCGCWIAVIVGVYRRSRTIRAAGASFVDFSAASRRMGNQNGVGALVMFVGAVLESTHTMFGAREFRGEWLIVLLCFSCGVFLQMHAQAKYLQALG